MTDSQFAIGATRLAIGATRPLPRGFAIHNQPPENDGNYGRATDRFHAETKSRAGLIFHRRFNSPATLVGVIDCLPVNYPPQQNVVSDSAIFRRSRSI